MAVPVHFEALQDASSNIKLKFYVDDLTIETDEFEIKRSGDFTEFIATYIEAPTISSTELELDTVFGAEFNTFTLKHSLGATLAEERYSIQLNVDFDVDGLTPLPKGYFSFDSGIGNSADSAATGIVDFSALKFSKFPAGQVFLYASYVDD